MENINLKEISSELVNKQKKIVATITIVDDGETTSALIAGEGEKLMNMLVGAMIDKPEFRKLIGRASLATAIYAAKS